MRVIVLMLAQTVFALSLEGGVNRFVGSLYDEIETCPYGAADLEFEMSNYTSLYVQGAYSYLKLKRNKDFYGLHQVIGRVGIETPERLLSPFAVGMGISIASVRGRDATEFAEEYMLSSSESEFGWNVRLEFNMFEFEKFKLGARFHYDEIWTKPKNSSVLHGGIFIGSK